MLNLSSPISQEARTQFRAAAEQLLYGRGNQLRSCVFKDTQVFPTIIYEYFLPELETLLQFNGATLKTFTKTQMLDAVEEMAQTNERFFQRLQTCMGTHDIRVPFYSEYNDNFDRLRGPVRLSDTPRILAIDPTIASDILGEGRGPLIGVAKSPTEPVTVIHGHASRGELPADEVRARGCGA